MDQKPKAIEPGGEAVFGPLRMQTVEIIGALFAVSPPASNHRIHDYQYAVRHRHRRLLHSGPLLTR
jgi:hypothetical protein